MDSEVLLKVLPLHVSDRNLCGSLSHVANHFRQRIKVLVGVSGNMFKWTALVARHVIVNRAIQTLLVDQACKINTGVIVNAGVCVTL